ncbi:hypothetical protein [Thermococcus sp. 21S9]|uniref:hypothetical protein n=1 Tax=Thermococcus sp. 21S9 TaxID=1638223 RepID=UPI00143A4748|nr:hypothetical protein [Thermococcus sp. 21S9]NJE54349.1 hypothetical protein [Thermococcus sp. 21S9]
MKELAKTAESAKAVVSELIRTKKAPKDIREVLTLLKTPAKITTKTGAKTVGKAIWGPINLILGITDFHDQFLVQDLTQMMEITLLESKSNDTM